MLRASPLLSQLQYRRDISAVSADQVGLSQLSAAFHFPESEPASFRPNRRKPA